jgi:hypothetical protein
VLVAVANGDRLVPVVEDVEAGAIVDGVHELRALRAEHPLVKVSIPAFMERKAAPG